MDPLLQLSSCFGLGILGGLVASLGIRYSIARRCFRLETTLLDHQKVILSLKGATYSEKRWGKRDQELAELEALKHKPESSQLRFDNDFGMRG